MEMIDCQDGSSDFIRRHLRNLHIEVYSGMNDLNVTSTNYLHFKYKQDKNGLREDGLQNSKLDYGSCN